MTLDKNRWHIWERNRRMKVAVFLTLGFLFVSLFIGFPIIAAVLS